MMATILPIDRAGTYGAGPPGVPASADEDKSPPPVLARKGRTPHYPFARKPASRRARTILNIFESGYRRWTMPEIRKDYATPTWVVFSAARSQRPGAFRNPKDATPKESCPFCEGHEAMTPPEVIASWPSQNGQLSFGVASFGFRKAPGRWERAAEKTTHVGVA